MFRGPPTLTHIREDEPLTLSQCGQALELKFKVRCVPQSHLPMKGNSPRSFNNLKLVAYSFPGNLRGVLFEGVFHILESRGGCTWLSLGSILHFCLLWFSGKSNHLPACFFFNFCSPSNVNQVHVSLVTCFGVTLFLTTAR